MPADSIPHHLETFAAARWPDRIRVLGRWMEPLSVGHILLLTRLGHPLVGGPQPFDAVAIGTAVALCSLPATRAFGHVRTWAFRLRVIYLSLRAAWNRRAAVQLTRYMVAGSRRPRTRKTGSGGASSVPFWLVVLTTLQRDHGMTEAEALDYPAAAAVWICIPGWEANGALQLVSETELQVVADVKAEAAAEAAKAAARN
jgi:hypothetical protein